MHKSVGKFHIKLAKGILLWRLYCSFIKGRSFCVLLSSKWPSYSPIHSNFRKYYDLKLDQLEYLKRGRVLEKGNNAKRSMLPQKFKKLPNFYTKWAKEFLIWYNSRPLCVMNWSRGDIFVNLNQLLRQKWGSRSMMRAHCQNFPHKRSRHRSIS